MRCVFLSLLIIVFSSDVLAQKKSTWDDVSTPVEIFSSAADFKFMECQGEHQQKHLRVENRREKIKYFGFINMKEKSIYLSKLIDTVIIVARPDPLNILDKKRRWKSLGLQPKLSKKSFKVSNEDKVFYRLQLIGAVGEYYYKKKAKTISQPKSDDIATGFFNRITGEMVVQTKYYNDKNVEFGWNLKLTCSLVKRKF